jgi:ribosomal protein S18 acetylase RimI-like enzyme
VIERRLLTADDWREWRALRLRALAVDPAAFGSTLADWSGPRDAEERWRRRFADVPVNLLLDLDGEPAGMVAAVPADDAVELISLWVAPEARGRGVGEAAIAAVVELAGNRPVVLSVRAANRPAIALYTRCGFVDEGPDPEDPLERRMRRAP